MEDYNDSHGYNASLHSSGSADGKGSRSRRGPLSTILGQHPGSTEGMSELEKRAMAHSNSIDTYSADVQPGAHVLQFREMQRSHTPPHAREGMHAHATTMLGSGSRKKVAASPPGLDDKIAAAERHRRSSR